MIYVILWLLCGVLGNYIGMKLDNVDYTLGKVILYSVMGGICGVLTLIAVGVHCLLLSPTLQKVVIKGKKNT